MTQDCKEVECAECDDESCYCRCHWGHEMMPESEDVPVDESSDDSGSPRY